MEMNLISHSPSSHASCCLFLSSSHAKFQTHTRNHTSIKASLKRTTLSTNWNTNITTKSNSSSAPIVTPPSRMPKLDELDTSNMLLRQRIVFLGSQVDDISADLIISQLLFLDAQDPKKDIKMFINSPGGSVTAGLGIYDAMKLCKADVSTVCLGLAASMGAFLLASGTKGKRFCMPNARVMIHQPSGGAGGNVSDMLLQIRESQYHKKKLEKIFSRLTGKSEEQIKEDTECDCFMTAWESMEYGLTDAVIDDGKVGLVAPLADSSPPPKTQIWHMWTVDDDRKSKKILPSEERLLGSGHNGKNAGHEKEATAPV